MTTPPRTRFELDRCLSQRVRAERHKLLGHARRLVIVEALEEGPREIPELARLLGVHTTTVRGHLEKLLEAGFLEAEPGVPAGRGRPPKRYRLRHPLLGGDPAVRLEAHEDQVKTWAAASSASVARRPAPPVATPRRRR